MKRRGSIRMSGEKRLNEEVIFNIPTEQLNKQIQRRKSLSPDVQLRPTAALSAEPDALEQSIKIQQRGGLTESAVRRRRSLSQVPSVIKAYESLQISPSNIDTSTRQSKSIDKSIEPQQRGGLAESAVRRRRSLSQVPSVIKAYESLRISPNNIDGSAQRSISVDKTLEPMQIGHQAQDSNQGEASKINVHMASLVEPPGIGGSNLNRLSNTFEEEEGIIDQSVSTLTSIQIDSFEELERYVAERMAALESVHLDEVEELNRILLDEMDAFKAMCKKELNKFSPDDDVDHHQIERMLVVQRMRMQRLKEYQENAHEEVQKRHAKEKKKVGKVMKKRFSQYKNAHESEKGKKEGRRSSVIKLLGFFNGPTFNTMIEGHPMSYEPLFQDTKEEEEREEDKKHGVQIERPLLTEFTIFKTEGQLPKIQVGGDGEFIYSYGDMGDSSDDEDQGVIDAYVQDKVKFEQQQQRLTMQSNPSTPKLNNPHSPIESFVPDEEKMHSNVEICWFSAQNMQGENLPVKTICLGNCDFQIIPPRTLN